MMKIPAQLALVLGLATLSGPAHADDDSIARLAKIQELRFTPKDESRSRVVPLKICLAEGFDGVQPVVLFSHGLGGSRENSVYLGHHWSRAGYAAVFMQHAGSDESVWKDAPRRERFTAMKNAASWKSSRDRIADVSFVIDQLTAWNKQAGHLLKGKLNLDRIGMSGHSFGGRTTAAVMGQRFPLNRQFAEPRLDAFLIFSPAVGRGQKAAAAFGHLRVPVLCMTGTNDRSPLDPTLTPESRRDVYQAMPAGDKYELVFDGGTHMAFSDRPIRRNEQRDPRIHPAIQKTSTAFWDAYLMDDAKSKAWLQSDKPKQDAGLSAKDVWQWK